MCCNVAAFLVFSNTYLYFTGNATPSVVQGSFSTISENYSGENAGLIKSVMPQILAISALNNSASAPSGVSAAGASADTGGSSGMVNSQSTAALPADINTEEMQQISQLTALISPTSSPPTKRNTVSAGVGGSSSTQGSPNSHVRAR